ncbi:alpha/beta hydrolase [Pseudooctadecabacter sp.]|uniref:alpha/beta hydrolase n=1 Tax=Pseudooctadecabacter sp. TaxID=1966338 RepID=UPI0025D75619|nr:alpha/beta hydrolase [Pseudooctadecabacter sp.]
MARLDDAYANSAHIPDGERFYGRWEAAAARFRRSHALGETDVAYGALPRQTYDIFFPDRLSLGTVVFLHGGYWMAGSPSMFSHLAAGICAAGYACAMPGYTLSPEASISQIVQEAALSVAAIAARTTGPIFLAGHSAGGHLAARLGCADMEQDWSTRVARIMPISPLGDLSPLMETSMNDTLRLTAQEAQAQSPVGHPAPRAPVHIWVGDAERPVFLEQARGLQAAWDCDLTVEARRHHFDVIEGLEQARSPMLDALFS